MGFFTDFLVPRQAIETVELHSWPLISKTISPFTHPHPHSNLYVCYLAGKEHANCTVKCLMLAAVSDSC